MKADDVINKQGTALVNLSRAVENADGAFPLAAARRISAALAEAAEASKDGYNFGLAQKAAAQAASAKRRRSRKSR